MADFLLKTFQLRGRLSQRQQALTWTKGHRDINKVKPRALRHLSEGPSLDTMCSARFLEKGGADAEAFGHFGHRKVEMFLELLKLDSNFGRHLSSCLDD